MKLRLDQAGQRVLGVVPVQRPPGTPVGRRTCAMAQDARLLPAIHEDVAPRGRRPPAGSTIWADDHLHGLWLSHSFYTAINQFLGIH